MRHLLLSLALLAAGSTALPAAAIVTAQAAAPDFTLKSAEGRNLRLQEQRGQVVLAQKFTSTTWPRCSCRRRLRPSALFSVKSGAALCGVTTASAGV